MDILKRMEGYSDLGSWAIWKSNNPDGVLEKEDDLQENINFEEYIDKLQPSNYVILAMNPGGNFNEKRAKKVTRKSCCNVRKWSNFHNVGKSRDYLFASAIMKTKLYGSYMTDLFPFEGSYSDSIVDFVENQENIHLIQRLIKEFDEEMVCLLPDEEEIILICIGTNVKKWAKKYLVKNSNLRKRYKVFYFPHYSSRNRFVSPKKDSNIYYSKVFKKKIDEYQLYL